MNNNILLKKRKAGFWIRSLSVFIDSLLFCIIAISSSLMCIEFKTFPQVNANIIQIKNNYLYYLWFLLIIVILVIEFLLIPILFQGRTLGMLITRLEVFFNNQSKNKVIWKRFKYGTLFWILMIVIFMISVYPVIINKIIILKYIKNNLNEMDEQVIQFKNDNKLFTFEGILYSIPSVTSPIIFLMEMFFLISIGFKKNKIGIIDKLSNSEITFINKYEEMNNLIVNIIQPIKNKKYQIEWKE